MSNSALQVKVTSLSGLIQGYKESQMGSMLSEADKLALAEQKIGKQSEIVAQQVENLEKQRSCKTRVWRELNRSQ